MNIDIKERLNSDVSLFNSVTSQEPDDIIKIKDYLRAVVSGTYKQQIKAIALINNNEDRNTAKKYLLPAVTIVGQFNPTRLISNITDHSGLIAIDIDIKGNNIETQFESAVKVKSKLDNESLVLATHFSASYRGVVVYVAVPYFTEYALHTINQVNGIYYSAISKLLYSEYGIIVDEAPKSIASLRFFSYDKDLHLNNDAEIFTLNNDKFNELSRVIVEAEPTSVSDHKSATDHSSSITAMNKLAYQVIKQGIDITQGYYNWVKIAYGLCTSFGEDGRDIFHKLGSLHPAYSFLESNEVYSKALGNNTGRVKAGTVFYLAFKKGVKYDKGLPKGTS